MATLNQVVKDFGDISFFGVNAEGEDIRLSIAKDSIILEPHQKMGMLKLIIM